MKNIRNLWLGLALLLPCAGVFAQNPQSMTLTIKQAQELFFKNNFLLLAAQYDINRSDAAIIFGCCVVLHFGFC